MGDNSVILRGVESKHGPLSMYSTVHGAGRVMSRTQAAGKRRMRWSCCDRDCDWFAGRGEHKPDDGNCPKCGHAKLSKQWVVMSKGEVSPEMMRAWIDKACVELRGAGLDESPHCYKRIGDVLDAHSDSIEILHTLTPVGVAMAK